MRKIPATVYVGTRVTVTCVFCYQVLASLWCQCSSNAWLKTDVNRTVLCWCDHAVQQNKRAQCNAVCAQDSKNTTQQTKYLCCQYHGGEVNAWNLLQLEFASLNHRDSLAKHDEQEHDTHTTKPNRCCVSQR